ncbi:helix-turn-helix domain-containing protein [Candidatus Micrarchaeota archaeon]|nr:helix-turn-helix domain-containing protein [Candidatus Micrarchaeota archaeon]
MQHGPGSCFRSCLHKAYWHGRLRAAQAVQVGGRASCGQTWSHHFLKLAFCFIKAQWGKTTKVLQNSKSENKKMFFGVSAIQMIRKELSPLLQDSARRSKDAKERERLRALYAISMGYPLPMVAEIFSVDEGTVYRWIERWQENRKLSDKPKRGRPVSLTEEDKKKIKILVEKSNPREHGMEMDFWNTRALQKYFVSRGKDVSQETIRRTLKEMGAKYVKPRPETRRAGTGKHRELAGKLYNADGELNPYALLVLLDEEIPKSGSEKNAFGWKFQRKLN